MFWSNKKDKDKRKSSGNRKCTKKESQKASGCTGDSSNSKSQRIREEALANARKARATIGEETLDKIAAAMLKRQNSPIEQARAAANKDPDRAMDELLTMLKSTD